MGENKLSNGNESVMPANLKEDAEVNKSWDHYLKPDLAHPWMQPAFLLHFPEWSPDVENQR